MLRIISIIVLLLFSFSTTATPVLAAINYSHDANGNMTSNGTKCYEYNDANQLKKIKRCSDNQIIAEYVYDYNGKRLVKKEYENGVLKQTVLSPSDEYETKKLPDGTTKNTTYYKVNDELAAKKNPDGSMNYYHNDHLGSNSVLTDQNGNVVEKTTYEPYGEVKSGGTKSKFGYTGQEKDLETGLNYYDARYYDSHIQRFIQPDTMLPDVYDPQQLNRYSYARNNPLKYTDPSGNFIFLPVLLVAVRVATAIAPAIYKAATSPAVRSAATVVLNNVNNAKSVASSAVNAGKSVASNLGNTIQTFASNTNNTSKVVNNPATNNTISNSGNVVGGIPKVADAKLNNYVTQFYKGVVNPNRIGSGTTPDAIRYELKTGLEVFGSHHVEKGEGLIRGIDRWLKNNPSASKSDIDIANTMKNELIDALKEK